MTKFKDDISVFITGFALLAVIYMLVRPGMPSARAIEDLSNLIAGMIRLATGASQPAPAQQSI